MITLLALFTVVVYEVTDATLEIEVYDYTKEALVEVICPEGVHSSDCLEPREPKRKETISLDDIVDCANNEDFVF